MRIVVYEVVKLLAYLTALPVQVKQHILLMEFPRLTDFPLQSIPRASDRENLYHRTRRFSSVDNHKRHN
jgi:hypothetical protein